MDVYRKNLIRQRGHFLRRAIHVSMGILPFLYYWYGTIKASWLHVSVEFLIILAMILTALIESVRLLRRRIVYGQRDYESTTISSTAWTIVSIGLVLLFAPKIGDRGAGLGVPLILSLCVGDPLMGEARIMGFSRYIVCLIGLIAVSLIWILCWYFLATPWWILPLIIPITVFSELIHFSWIDDNATMLLIPLIVLLILFHSH